MSYTAFTLIKIHRKVEFFSPTQTFVTAKCADRELNWRFRNHSTVLFLVYVLSPYIFMAK